MKGIIKGVEIVDAGTPEERIQFDVEIPKAVDERDISEYDERLVRQLIENVTVYGDRFTVEFKSGVTVDVEV